MVKVKGQIKVKWQKMTYFKTKWSVVSIANNFVLNYQHNIYRISVPVAVFIPNPLRCFSCQKFGSKTRKGSITSSNCSQAGHTANSCHCQGQPNCCNCSGSPPASSKKDQVAIWKKISRLKQHVWPLTATLKKDWTLLVTDGKGASWAFPGRTK